MSPRGRTIDPVRTNHVNCFWLITRSVNGPMKDTQRECHRNANRSQQRSPQRSRRNPRPQPARSSPQGVPASEVHRPNGNVFLPTSPRRLRLRTPKSRESERRHRRHRRRQQRHPNRNTGIRSFPATTNSTRSVRTTGSVSRAKTSGRSVRYRRQRIRNAERPVSGISISSCGRTFLKTRSIHGVRFT